MIFCKRLFWTIAMICCALALSVSGIQDEEYIQIQPRSVEGDGAYSNELQLLLDGKFAAPGTSWNGDRCVFWEDELATFVFDLAAEYQIVDVLLQVDDNDIYTVEYSDDGLNFTPLVVFYVGYGSTGSGLDSMSTDPGSPQYAAIPPRDPVQARFLRLSASSGDGKYALAEFQVFGYALGNAAEPLGVPAVPAGILGFGDFSHSADLIIDGRTPAEGGEWDGDASVYWSDPESYFVIDLGRLQEVIGIEIQVNPGNGYRVDYSKEDREYISLVEILDPGGDIDAGMDTISTIPGNPEYISDLDFFPVQARYLKIYAMEGSGPFAVSELLILVRE